MLAGLLALVLVSAPPPAHAGVFRRAAPADDGVHVAVFLYRPERMLPGAPLVVLLPDLGATHDFFDLRGEGLARSLSASGFPVVTLDWRGTGLSQVPPRSATLDDLLQHDVPTAANVLGSETPLVLVGWGYGGTLAYAAAAGPLRSRVRAVVGLNAVVDLDVPNAVVERMLQARSGPVDLAMQLALPAPQRSGTLFELLWTTGAELDPSAPGELLAHGLGSLSGAQVEQLFDWMHTGQTRLGGEPYPALLDHLEVPTLALMGPLDNWTHPEFAAGIRDHVHERLLTFRAVNRFDGFREDVGHVGLVLGETARRELAPLIIRFLRDHALHQAEARR